jgi:hypothetical protein
MPTPTEVTQRCARHAAADARGAAVRGMLCAVCCVRHWADEPAQERGQREVDERAARPCARKHLAVQLRQTNKQTNKQLRLAFYPRDAAPQEVQWREQRLRGAKAEAEAGSAVPRRAGSIVERRSGRNRDAAQEGARERGRARRAGGERRHARLVVEVKHAGMGARRRLRTASNGVRRARLPEAARSRGSNAVQRATGTAGEAH